MSWANTTSSRQTVLAAISRKQVLQALEARMRSSPRPPAVAARSAAVSASGEG
jgi:hypothetical protein